MFQTLRIDRSHASQLLEAIHAVGTTNCRCHSHELRVHSLCRGTDNLDCAALQRKSRYYGIVFVRVDHCAAAICTRRLTAEDDAARITAKPGNVIAQPL